MDGGSFLDNIINSVTDIANQGLDLFNDFEKAKLERDILESQRVDITREQQNLDSTSTVAFDGNTKLIIGIGAALFLFLGIFAIARG